MEWMLLPWKRCLDFRGRSTRMEYWLFWLFFFAGSIVTYIADDALFGVGDNMGFLRGIFTFAILLPGTAVGVRRLHDTGRSGWWLLLSLLGLIGWIFLIIFFATDGTRGVNRFGPDPTTGEQDLQNIFS